MTHLDAGGPVVINNTIPTFEQLFHSSPPTGQTQAPPSVWPRSLTRRRRSCRFPPLTKGGAKCRKYTHTHILLLAYETDASDAEIAKESIPQDIFSISL